MNYDDFKKDLAAMTTLLGIIGILATGALAWKLDHVNDQLDRIEQATKDGAR